MERHQLSANFYLDEFTVSQTAARMGRKIVVALDSPEYRDLRRLCTYVLQPLREALGPVFVTSGIRPRWLNKTLPGTSRKSQHMVGQATDFRVVGFSPYEVCAWLIGSDLPYDQNINEFGQWTHVSINPIDRRPRRQVLTAYTQPRVLRAAKTLYVPGLHQIADLARAA